jgi:serine/threonine protein kinase
MGKYEVVQHLATGGMGKVYRAHDTEHHRDVAIKVLPPEMAAQPHLLERFKREFASASKLDHDNIVRAYEFGECGGTWFLAMEYVEGYDLHDHVKQLGSLDPEEARQIILQAARALRHAHAQRIVHRDIKPSNFLLTSNTPKPIVKLLDFGLAREIDADDFRVTRAGTTVGTIDYMSPEQARDSGAADIRSDLYSLGCTWYHLLCGQSPFPEGSLTERINKLINEAPPDLRDLNPRLSDECWTVIARLLAKDPNERYQTPAELIEVLHDLEGKTVSRRRGPRSKSPKRRAASGVPGTSPTPRRNRLTIWYAVAGLVGVGILAGAIAALSMPRRLPDSPEEHSSIEPAPLPPPVAPPREERIIRTTTLPIIKKEDSAPNRPPVEVKTLRTLSPSVLTADIKALRAEVDAPWKETSPVPADAQTVRVSRAAPLSPQTFRSMADACKAGPPGKPLIIEIHDNGPLFELPIDPIDGRHLIVRAGTGYRPLIVWDMRGTMSRLARKPDAPHFLSLKKGRLQLEGLELAVSWPSTLEKPGTLFDLEDTELCMRDCTLSVAGKPRVGFTLARFHSTSEGARLRWTRCQLRGAGLTALDLDAPAAEILYDGCLVVGGQQTLLRIKAGTRASRLRLVRSTFVGGPTFLEVKPARGEQPPAFALLGWDSLLGQASGEGDNSLFRVLDGGSTRNMQWRAVNCLYAGWKRLLTGPESIADHGAWQRHWAGVESDGVSPNPWPEQVYNEPSTQPASAYQPTQAVLYGATVDRAKPLGCDLSALPPARDGWLAQTIEPNTTPPDLPTEDSPPDIPNPGDGKYHGGRIDLTMIDLGAELTKMQAARSLGPRIVLHLTGKGECLSSPIRLKGVDLVLHFESPAERDGRKWTLNLGRSSTVQPLIEIEGGSLEVIGGVLRMADESTVRASHLVRVKGGDIRLYRTRLEGPQQTVPDGYVAALCVVGSGDPDKPRSCAIHECVFLSSQTGLLVEGIGCRVAMRQGLVVAGTDGLQIAPGAECLGRTGIQVALTRMTIAARRAVLHLGDAPKAGVPTEPAIVQARECAYLNPFANRPARAGLLVYSGEALPRGLLVWQGEREGFDSRLHFAAAALSTGIADTKEGYAPWKSLWSASGVREPRELSLLPVFDSRRPWALERLILRMRDAPGANLERLGISVRKK